MTIDDLYSEWIAAIRKKDVDAVIALLTPDYTLWVPGKPPMNGRDAMRQPMTAALAAYDLEPVFEREAQFVDGDLAIDFGWDSQTLTPRAGGESKTMRQRVAVVMQRGTDGRWRFARGISQPGPEA